ncbi:hypothetical protein DICVIV_10995 [Dictyocaulus viviparus]|uniref:Protein amnionless n=1 Tax=Dictyocaulus viviparus TaxID=29172 RepID=A0A0D8XKX4_DICVI|nr:hypothetical protein DICVIV_10995 [Dictyocaulus viviparus]
MMTFTFLWLLISIQTVSTETFVFSRSTRISQLNNWLNANYPCQDDTIIFEENKKTVTFLDESIQISSIILPQVGSMIFSDNSVIGEKSRWQCTRRKSPENVFFQPNSVFPAFSDPASWSLKEQPLLHMNQVPGAKASFTSSFRRLTFDLQGDDVIFTDMGAFQIFIDDQITVNSLRFSQDWVSIEFNFHYRTDQ